MQDPFFLYVEERERVLERNHLHVALMPKTFAPDMVYVTTFCALKAIFLHVAYGIVSAVYPLCILYTLYCLLQGRCNVEV